MKVWETVGRILDSYISEFKVGAPGYIYDKRTKKFYLVTVEYVSNYRMTRKRYKYKVFTHFGEDYYIGLSVVRQAKRKELNFEISGCCWI